MGSNKAAGQSLTILRALAVAGAVVTSGVSAMGVAAADDAPNGFYTRTYLTSTTSLFRPSVVHLTPCGAGCTHWKLLDNDYPGFNMYLQDNRWVDTRSNGIAHSFDKDTFIGTTSGEVWEKPFSDSWVLTKNG